MNPSDHSPDKPLESRLTELEALFTHLQRTVADLDEIILAQGKRLDETERRLQQLDQQVETLGETATEPRNPEDEKPPHY